MNYVDEHFRIIANRSIRGLTGLSMGANGALKISMLFPEIFSTVYASTPATLNWSDGINTSLEAFKLISNAKGRQAIPNRSANLLVNLGKTY